MKTETPKTPSVLTSAWAHYAQLDAFSNRRSRAHKNLRIWIILLGALAVLLAVLVALYFSGTPSLAGVVVKALLILTPAAASVLAAFGTRIFGTGNWLITRAAAEEHLNEIYFYRTILRNEPGRDAHLEKRIEAIQAKMNESLGSTPRLKPFRGNLPPYYSPADANSDPGFTDLNGAEYFKYRLEHQLAWHQCRVDQYERERSRLTTLLIVTGGLGALLAAFGGPIAILVAVTASLAAALTSWQQFRSLDLLIRNYSKVILELTTLYDHWTNLEPEQRTDLEFYNMVQGCEAVLSGQNAKWIRTMQEALKASGLEKDASLVDNVMQETREAAQRTKERLRQIALESAQEFVERTRQQVHETFKSEGGSLAEEAASDIVQRELDALLKQVSERVKAAAEAAPEPTASTDAPATGAVPPETSRPIPVEQVAFSAYHPKEGRVAVWHPLVVYIHNAAVIDQVRRDVSRYLDTVANPKETTQTATTQMARGTEITIVPSCEGVTFNPKQITLQWLEDYQRAEFRFSADEALLDDAAKGRIDFFVGPLIVGSLKFAMLFNNNQEQPVPDQEETADMYHKDSIFVSYSHKDTDIVEAFKKVHEATGYDVLIDIDDLRSGQEWNDELMHMIDRADIFQLFWSENASQSKYCQQEWQHALARNREGFIRPVYWQSPMPDPPEELSKYHFEYVQI